MPQSSTDSEPSNFDRRTVSLSDQVKAHTDALTAAFISEYPHLDRSVIATVIEQCNGDATICRCKIQELASREATNPVFSSIYGACTMPTATNPSNSYSSYYPMQFTTGQEHGPHLGSRDGRRWRPAPLITSTHHARTTQDSGVSTMSPPIPSSLLLLSPPATSSTDSGSRSASPRHSRNPFSFLRKKRHTNVSPTCSPMPVSPQVLHHDRSGAMVLQRYDRLQKNQRIVVSPTPNSGGGSPSQYDSARGVNTQPRIPWPGMYDSASGVNAPAGMRQSPPVMSLPYTPDPQTNTGHLSPQISPTDSGHEGSGLVYAFASTEAAHTQAYLTQQTERKDKMAGANEAHKLSVTEVIRDLQALSMFYNTEYKEPVHITEVTLRALQFDVQNLEKLHRDSNYDSVMRTASCTTPSGDPCREGGGCSAEHVRTISAPSLGQRPDSINAPGQNYHPVEVERSWSCSQCTFDNHQDLARCELCDLPRITPTVGLELAESQYHSSPASCYCCAHQPQDEAASAPEGQANNRTTNTQTDYLAEPTFNRQISQTSDDWTLVDPSSLRIS